MVKKNIFILICLITTTACYAQKKSYVGFFESDNECIFEIDKSNITIQSFSRQTERVEKKIVPVQFEIKYNLPFIIIEGKKYLCLSCDFFFYLYDSNSSLVFDGCNCSLMKLEFIDYIHNIQCSSFLTEGEKEYSSDKLSNKIGQPWVEGKDGNGEGEYIYFDVGKNDDIYISIGYVDYNHPELYLQNSRPKKMKVYLDDAFLQIITLEDTPDFQKIPIKIENSGVLKFEILAVYSGTKYKDTCINMLLCDMSKRFE